LHSGPARIMVAFAPLRPRIGAEVTGVDITRPLAPGVAEQIATALQAHGVLVISAQPCTDEQHISFGRSIGAIEPPLATDPAAAASGLPVFHMTNVDAEGRLIPPSDVRVQYSDGNRVWHSDGSFRPDPLRASLLSAKVVTPEQGETEFASLTAAYADLPESRKAALEGLEAEYSLAHSRRHLPPTVTQAAADTKEIGFIQAKAVRHPLVRTHRLSGARALHVGGYAERIVGMGEEEGQALLAELLDHATQCGAPCCAPWSAACACALTGGGRAARPQYVYRHRWKAGDMVVYDNVACAHRAMPWRAELHKRTLHRVTLAGAAGSSARL